MDVVEAEGWRGSASPSPCAEGDVKAARWHRGDGGSPPLAVLPCHKPAVGLPACQGHLPAAPGGTAPLSWRGTVALDPAPPACPGCCCLLTLGFFRVFFFCFFYRAACCNTEGNCIILHFSQKKILLLFLLPPHTPVAIPLHPSGGGSSGIPRTGTGSARPLLMPVTSLP